MGEREFQVDELLNVKDVAQILCLGMPPFGAGASSG
jgi:hypothetical protein